MLAVEKAEAGGGGVREGEERQRQTDKGRTLDCRALGFPFLSP